MSKKSNIFNLSFCGVMIALGTVLSFVTFFKLPLGGSITLCSMLPIMIVGYFLGVKWGFFSAFVFALIQVFISLGEMMSWSGVSTKVLVASIFLDYLIPYTLIGLTGIFAQNLPANERKFSSDLIRFALGMVFVVALRFLCHFISGMVLFSTWATFKPLWLYSICYNGSFLLPDLILCIVVGILVFKPITALFKKYN